MSKEFDEWHMEIYPLMPHKGNYDFNVDDKDYSYEDMDFVFEECQVRIDKLEKENQELKEQIEKFEDELKPFRKLVEESKGTDIKTTTISKCIKVLVGNQKKVGNNE